MFSSPIKAEDAKQAVKTAIAGVISMYVTRLFHLPEGYWAAISSLIVMQSNVGSTLTASRTRLAGTAAGALVGGAFVALWGVNMLAFGVAVTIAYLLCSVLKLPDSQRLATVTVAIIMLVGRVTSPWTVALHRFVEVSLGILIALVISLTLWPNHARRSLRDGLAAALLKLGTLYQALTVAGRVSLASDSPESLKGPLEALNAQVSDVFQKNAALLANALQEAFGPMRERESLTLLSAQVDRIRRAVETLELTAREGALDTYVAQFHSELTRAHAALAEAFESLANGIRRGKLEPQWPPVTEAISALDKRATQVRASGLPVSYPLDEILRFYSLLLGSRNLAQEMELACALVTSRFVSK